MSAKLQAAYDALVTGFVAPLVSGGEAHVGAPIAPGALSYFAQTQSGSSETDTRILDGLHATATELAPLRSIPWPSPGSLALASALYDLLWLTDPSLTGVIVGAAPRAVADWVDRLMASIAPPETRGEALLRYALLEPVFDMERRDATVRTWAYTHRFFGRPVPWNVVAMPRVRFVRREESRSSVRALFAKAEELRLMERFRALVSRSPVTELLRAHELVGERTTGTAFTYSVATLRVLADRALSGGIARRIAAHSEWSSASLLGAALPQLAKAPPELATIALRFLLELHVTSQLDERDKKTPRELDPGQQRYAALLLAFFEDAPALEDVRVLDDGDRALLVRRAESLRPLVPGPVLTEMSSLVTYARFHGEAA